MPAHAPHVGSEIKAPEARRSASNPSRAMVSRMRWLPGNRTNETSGCTCRPWSTWDTAHMSSHEPFVQEPTITCTNGSWEDMWAVTQVLQRSEEHTSELQSRQYLVCRLLVEQKK